MMDFRLPALGEGIEGGTITEISVKPGDAVKPGQQLFMIETDKATMPVEADNAGTVEQILVKLGDKVPVGTPLLKLQGAATGTSVAAAPASSTRASAPPPPSTAPSPPPPSVAAKPEAQPAAASTQFRLPALGEGIEGGTITEISVKPGDAVKPGQQLFMIETDKATMPVEADNAGTVEQILVKLGDKVPVGGNLLVLKTGKGVSIAATGAGQGGREASSEPANNTQPVSVEAAPKEAVSARPSSPSPVGNGAAVGTKTLIPAGPATRRLARELGVTLNEVRGSGRGGRVTLDDVKGFVKTERQKVKETGGVPAGGMIVNAFTLPTLPDFSKFGPVEVIEVATIRQTIAKNLTIGWRTMPMVTQHELADITELEAGRKRIVDALPKGSPKITMTVLAIKACVAALKEYPRFNSSYDMNAGKLILKKYFHVGIAVDTERGLVVPVIRDADKKSIRDLAGEVATLAEKARANKLAIDEMRGGTFTITNLGGIGGTAFTPIVNYPEVAILGLSKSTLQAVVKDGQIVPRLMMPLSLTYDHRVIDGADGCRFTVRLAQLFSDPLRLLMET